MLWHSTIQIIIHRLISFHKLFITVHKKHRNWCHTLRKFCKQFARVILCLLNLMRKMWNFYFMYFLEISVFWITDLYCIVKIQLWEVRDGVLWILPPNCLFLTFPFLWENSAYLWRTHNLPSHTSGCESELSHILDVLIL